MIKNVDRWIGSYIVEQIGRVLFKKPLIKPTHIIFSCVDHFEPDWNSANDELQERRIHKWIEEYPALAKKHRDADGCHPRHTFFYPAETYNQRHLDLLKDICDHGFGEVEIHLHHDGDTEESLRAKLEKAKNDFSSHGFLGRRRLSGHIRFAFIHGNWALNNSRKDQRWCGVNNETYVLGDAGCYADFTFPSAPSETQPKKINSLYYAKSKQEKPKTHNKGPAVKVRKYGKGDLLIIQGPLTLNWRNRKKGILPRIENSEISGANPPTNDRVDLWMKQRVSVVHKADWIFVKVYTHGAPEKNAGVLLGEPMDKMYSYIENKYNDQTNYILHYTSAREMYNIIKAAEAGEKGEPGDYRDYIIERNGLK